LTPSTSTSRKYPPSSVTFLLRCCFPVSSLLPCFFAAASFFPLLEHFEVHLLFTS
jgi:hypothetical protein